jgi:eukaryotic-like serine/threonine-protein kinase
MVGLAGKTLDRYVLGQRIGKGGMADVYLGYDPYFQRAVAIKIFKQDNDGMLQRFMREAKIMASLHHPHLMPIYDTGESEVDGLTRYYIVMPFVDGGTLGTRIHHSELTPEDVSKYLLDIATALDYIHTHGIIHRDIKSTNVLLSTDDLCYLSDLGVARLVNDVYTFTSTGNVLGTVDYIAPELFVGNNKADALSDIYSLGILLFEMVTGRRPFAAENQVALASMHVNETPPLARTLVATISPAIEQVLVKALEKDPTRRFPTAIAMAEAFYQATKMPQSFIPEVYTRSEDFAPDAVGVALPDQFTIKQAIQAPITADLQMSADTQDIAPVTPISRPKRSRARILTPLLIALLFVIAVPSAWLLGQMQTTTTIIRTGGTVVPTSVTLANHITGTATATPKYKITPVPTPSSSTPVVASTPVPSPLPQIQPTSVPSSSHSATPLPFPGNTVQDPGYEAQNSMQIAPPWVGVGTASIVLNANQARSGNNAARIVPTVNNAWSDISQVVNIKTNTAYTLSAYIYTSQTLNTNATIFDVIAVHGPDLEQVHYAPSPAGYTQISLTFNSASYNAVTIRIGFVGQKNMWVQADDWYLHS